MPVPPWGETPDEAPASRAGDDRIGVRFAAWLATDASPEDWHRIALDTGSRWIGIGTEGPIHCGG